jgi:murein DD-endopeptidase MepM/ murein hydrolase activator NlpD
MLGQRFAYDFVRVDRRKGWHMHPAGGWRSNLIGVPVRECYAWGQPVHMPFDGEIVAARDGYPERERVVPIREIAIVLKNGLTFDIKGDLAPVAGNHVIARLRDVDVFAFFAHLVPGTVAVSKGDVVRRADPVGRVGHTGNSTASIS